MQLTHILTAAGLVPAMASAKGVISRRSVDCSYTTTAEDGATCDSFASSWGITVTDLTGLNPGIICPNLDTSKSYCVMGTVTDDPEPVLAAQDTTLRTSTVTVTTTATATAPNHSPTMPGVVANCDGFHKVVSGDQCDIIASRYGLSVAQFKSWNTQVNDGCTNLWLGYYVCVHVPDATTTSVPSPTPTAPTPQMPGIVPNCRTFYQVKPGDTCYSISTAAGVALSQLLSWNTAIDSGCSNLWLGYYICIGV